MKVCTREIEPCEYPLLEDFLYLSVFIPKGEALPPRDIIFDPNIHVYIKDFGEKTGDTGVLATCDGKAVGAAWARIIPAYGHIDENTPELAIAVQPAYRGQGVGEALMQHLFDLLRKKGYTRTSLSVQKDNPACRFYRRLGYQITDEKLDQIGNEDYIMVRTL
jgi:ribosomal protein S18 acetylase RimI-like enzyme